MSVSRTKSVGFGLTGVFAFFVLSNLFNVLVLKANSRGAVSRRARPRLNASPSSHLQHLEKGLRGSEQPALTPSALLPHEEDFYKISHRSKHLLLRLDPQNAQGGVYSYQSPHTAVYWSLTGL